MNIILLLKGIIYNWNKFFSIRLLLLLLLVLSYTYLILFFRLLTWKLYNITIFSLFNRFGFMLKHSYRSLIVLSLKTSRIWFCITITLKNFYFYLHLILICFFFLTRLTNSEFFLLINLLKLFIFIVTIIFISITKFYCTIIINCI